MRSRSSYGNVANERQWMMNDTKLRSAFGVALAEGMGTLTFVSPGPDPNLTGEVR